MEIWILNHHAREEGRHPSIAKYLKKLDNNVTLFSASFLHNTFNETKTYKKKQNFIIEKDNEYKRVFIKTPKYFGNGLKRFVNQITFAYSSYFSGVKTSDKPDVIIGSSVHLFTGLSAYLLSKKLNAKFIFEIRDIWPQTLIDLGAIKESSFIAKLFIKIEKFLYKKADLIISVLPNAYKHIEEYGISKSKVFYLPNGLDVESFNEDINSNFTEEDIKKFFIKNNDKFVVTFTGAHGLANGLDTVINAAHELKYLEKNASKKSHILLVGSGPEKENLINQAQSLNLDNITFFNRVDKKQVPHILKHSNVCLFHLRKTPVFKFGISSNKLFDYMMSENPMIFAVETSYNFATEANNGLSIKPENPTEMANAIIELKNKPDYELKRLGENGKEFLKENHDLKKLSQKLQDRLKTL